MTLDELCAEARGLKPGTARMAFVMLRIAGPLPTVWHAALADALAVAAQGVEPFAPSEIEDVLAAAVNPGDRPAWLLHDEEFMLAHRFVVDAHLSAEKWKLIVMTLLDDEDHTMH